MWLGGAGCVPGAVHSGCPPAEGQPPITAVPTPYLGTSELQSEGLISSLWNS